MSTLQTQIQTAIQGDPSLVNSSVQAVVSDTTITLTGTVPTGKEKQTAKRIAQSYAGNRRVEDKITVTGRGQSQRRGGSASSPGAIGGSTGSSGTGTSTSTSTETGTGATSANPSGTSNPNSATTPDTGDPNSTTDPKTSTNPNTPPQDPKTAGDQASPR